MVEEVARGVMQVQCSGYLNWRGVRRRKDGRVRVPRNIIILLASKLAKPKLDIATSYFQGQTNLNVRPYDISPLLLLSSTGFYPPLHITLSAIQTSNQQALQLPSLIA